MSFTEIRVIRAYLSYLLILLKLESHSSCGIHGYPCKTTRMNRERLVD